MVVTGIIVPPAIVATYQGYTVKQDRLEFVETESGFFISDDTLNYPPFADVKNPIANSSLGANEIVEEEEPV